MAGADQIARLEIDVSVPNADRADRQLARIEDRTARLERAAARRARAEQIAARQMEQNVRIARQYEASFRQIDAFQRATAATGTAARRAANDNQALTASFGALRAAIIALGLGRVASEFVGMADSAKLIEGRLKLVTSSQEELVAVNERLFQIAQRTRQSYEGTATLFQRVARSADQLGRSQEEVLQFTELVQKAIVSSGASSQEATAGMIQLSQALASGKLAGDEFRSVLENFPAIAKAAGDGLNQMGLTTKRGSDALYELRDAGKLTADNFITAIFRMRKSIEGDFEKIPVTVGQAFTVLRNEVFRATAEFDKTHGVTARLSSGILSLAGNFNVLGKAVSGLLAAGGFLALVRTSAALAGILGAVAVDEEATAVADRLEAEDLMDVRFNAIGRAIEQAFQEGVAAAGEAVRRVDPEAPS